MIAKLAMIIPFALIVAVNASAQYTIELPQFVPASPEATNFVKAGVGNVNMATGAATANVPLYTIRVKDFAFPIALSYSTQGLKADEASSRVGLNWTISNTAMITRIVRGEPDELSTRMPVPYFGANTDALFTYFQNSTNAGAGYDTQPDEFQFNCNGYSGKFILDNSYVPQITSTSNIKIDLSMAMPPSSAGVISTIKLTTPDGVIYWFGTNYEKTSDHNIAKFSPYKFLKTSFFLDRIDLPNNEYITFNYTNIGNVNVTTGNTQTLQVPLQASILQCGGCGSYNSYTTSLDRVTYVTNILTNITTSNGQSVNFSYVNRADGSGDKKLDAMSVVGVKELKFEYYTPDSVGQISAYAGRFFLTKVRDVTMSPSLDHVFTYQQMSSVPLPINFRQDYLGFYNNGPSAYFIPPTLGPNGTIDFSFRNPSSTYSKMGTLTSIQYPTGGTEEITYEPNRYLSITPHNNNYSYNLLGPGDGSSGTYVPHTYSMNFTVPYTQTVTVTGSVTDNGYNVDATHHTLSVWVNESGSSLGSFGVVGYNSNSMTLTLQSGHTYQLQMWVSNYTETGDCSLFYQLSSTPVYDTTNVESPGVRVKQIKYTDPVTASTHSKYYTYAKLEHLNLSTLTSANLVNFGSGSTGRYYCYGGDINSTECPLAIYSSSSTGQLYSNSGSGGIIYYSTVIESDDPSFANGGTEYTFYENDNGGNLASVYGNAIPFLAPGQYPTLSGLVKQTRYFDNNNQVIRIESDDYEILSYPNTTPSIYVRKVFQPSLNRPDKFEAFDAVRCDYGSTWNRLKTKTITTYANGTALTQQSNYAYGITTNILPMSITTTDSKGNVVKSVMDYPTSISGYSALISKNMITPVVRQSSYKNGVLMQQKQILYRDWMGDASVLAPEKIQLMASPTDVLHDAVIFKQYSASGNAQQLQKAYDLPIVYLWDEALSVPIAEIKNAIFGQVAFSGFENNALGNWAISYGGPHADTVFTGINSFTGKVTRTVATAGTYVVSLWTGSAKIPKVNNVAGTVMNTAKGWKLYQWTLNLTSPLSVSVIGCSIDEVRLLPAGATMETFSHKPFIGVTSRTDNNSTVTYFNYDNLGRLSYLTDFNGNIVKGYEYQYQH